MLLDITDNVLRNKEQSSLFALTSISFHLFPFLTYSGKLEEINMQKSLPYLLYETFIKY